MATYPDYRDNPELFGRFHDAQRDLVKRLSQHRPVIAAWLAGKRSSSGEERGEGAGAEKNWRTARLSAQRRRRLRALLDDASAEAPACLAQWLLASLPVGSFFEIAEAAQEDFGELRGLRDRLFYANYGLAKSAAGSGHNRDFADRLSAACTGLLDAIDRYVPGEKSARFGYFAGYWIRYHLCRQAQKHGCVVSFPIHQHRVGRRVERFLAARQGGPEEAPTEAELCTHVGVGVNALYWQGWRPQVVSIHAPAENRAEELERDLLLRDPAPLPSAGLEAKEVAERLRAWLRRRLPPASRVLVAYRHGIGIFSEAALDYLDHLREITREHLT